MKFFNKVHSFIAIIRANNAENLLQEEIFDSGHQAYFHKSQDGRLEVAFSLKDSNQFVNDDHSVQMTRLILGDHAEWQETQGESCMAAGAFVEFDTSKNYLKLVTSVVGLPPFFIYRDSALIVITSDIHLLYRIAGISLHFNLQAVGDLCQIGYPINGMTLFKEVMLVPGGSSWLLKPDGDIRQSSLSLFGDDEKAMEWPAYLDLQADTLKRAMEAIDISKSFLSLTAGLDTRAIMAMLVAKGRSLPAYTLTGTRLTLDARIAGSLCKAYQFSHTAVVLGDDFYRNLPDYIIEASRHSGGLTSLDQAHEIYFYKSVNRDYEARLCGNLGNQVGRRGVERVSMRNVDSSILNSHILTAAKRNSHWYTTESSQGGAPDFEFLIRNEIPSSSVANYCIGNYFATQQSPYANHKLIKNVKRMPTERNAEEKLSVWQLRLRDLKHRFLGQAPEQSFQVRLIRETGGYLASCPINWGWRAKGGISVKGMMYGGLTFIDALATKKELNSQILSKSLDRFGITGLHEYKHTNVWLRAFLKEFIHDTLLSSSVRNGGLFENGSLTKILNDHFTMYKSHEKEIILALDLALAQDIFKASVQ